MAFWRAIGGLSFIAAGPRAAAADSRGEATGSDDGRSVVCVVALDKSARFSSASLDEITALNAGLIAKLPWPRTPMSWPAAVSGPARPGDFRRKPVRSRAVCADTLASIPARH